MITVVLLSLGLMACSNTKKEKMANTDEISIEKEGSVIDWYIELKDAFVATDMSRAQVAAKKLNAILPTQGNEKLIEAANAITTSSDIEDQRAQFKIITDGLIELFRANGKEDGLYVQFCPMAFNNTGAKWLSLSEEIRNPYFGEKMLKCGKVEEEL